VQKCNFVKEYKEGHFKSLNQFVAYKKKIFSCSALNNWIKAWNDGTLKVENCTGRKKQRKGSFPEVEERIIEYINLHQKKYKTDKCGLSWLHLQQKAKDYAKIVYADDEETLTSFQASPGWLSNVLKSRNNYVLVNQHREASELTESFLEERTKSSSQPTLQQFFPLQKSSTL